MSDKVLIIDGLTRYKTLDGNQDSDILLARNNAHRNTLRGKRGNDKLYAWDYAYYNRFRGGEGSDILEAEDSAHYNTFSGNGGNDTLYASNNTRDNVFNGNKGSDKLSARDDAFDNTLNGNEGNDLLLAYGDAFSNILNGGEGHDVIVSSTGGLLSGEIGNDFILTYLPGANLFPDRPLTMIGGDNNDVLIGSGSFWQAREEFESEPSWIFDAGADDDIIIPYIPIETLNVDKDLQRNIDYSKQRATFYGSSNEIRNMHYQVMSGDGKDIIALSSTPAKNVTTHIKDFNWSEDRLAFDNEDTAQNVLLKLALAKKFSTPAAVFNYKGHQYTFSTSQHTPMSIPLKTAILDGIKVQYPDLENKIDLSYNYALYNSKAVADTLSNISNSKKLNRSLFDGVFEEKTFSKTYTNELDENIFVVTKQALNLIPSKKGGFKVALGGHLSNIMTSFRGRDLFADEDKRTCVYHNLKTDEISYFKIADTLTPENVVAIVVVQENSNGLVFTTQSKSTKLPSLTKEQSTQIFTAADFFTKGHFAMTGEADPQNLSVTMKLGLVLKGKDNNLITTPLGEPIQVKVGK